MVRSTCPFDSGFLAPRITGRIRNAPNRAATSVWRRTGREWGTTIAESRSNATFSGAPPRRIKVPENAPKKSAIPLAKVNTAAWGRRMRQSGDQTEHRPGPLFAHRHRQPKLPPVGLAELIRQIASALIALRLRKHRADLLEVVLEDGDPTLIAVPTEMLEDHPG